MQCGIKKGCILNGAPLLSSCLVDYFVSSSIRAECSFKSILPDLNE